MTKNSKNRSKLTKLLALGCVMAIFASVFAYFTDRVTFTPTNGDITVIDDGVDIIPEKDPTVDPDDPTNPNKPGGAVDPEDWEDPTPADPTDDLNNWWAYLNAKAMVNFNPGDKMTLNYSLTNDGALDVKTRETFVVTSSQAIPSLASVADGTTFTPDASQEFTLCTGFATDAAGANTANAFAGMTFTKISNTQYKVTVAEETLAKDASDAKTYFLVFNPASSNDFQGDTCRVDYLVEAMQANGEWVKAVEGTVDMNGHAVEAVPAQ